jgi:hypothetical protein
MIGLAAMGLSYAKTTASTPGARAALAAAHTAVAGYILSQTVKETVNSAMDTRNAAVEVYENARPQIEATLAKIKALRLTTEQVTVTNIDSSARTA